MNTLEQLFSRVAAWNAARYDQVLNIQLLGGLLAEELVETLDAETEVATLDGLCDVAYVALGGAWKSGLPADDVRIISTYLTRAMHIVHDLVSLKMCDALSFMTSFVHAIYTNDDVEKTRLRCFVLVLLAAEEAQASLDLDRAKFLDALAAVCDSNDTKIVHKVDPAVKANTGNKGPNYVPPTAALEHILAMRT